MAAYKGLLMGCAKTYWVEKIKVLYDTYYKPSRENETGAPQYPFEWSDVYKRAPDITKKDLTRIKSSRWIEKDIVTRGKVNRWVLSQDAISLCSQIE
jgi:hypothetical protein